MVGLHLASTKRLKVSHGGVARFSIALSGAAPYTAPCCFHGVFSPQHRWDCILPRTTQVAAAAGRRRLIGDI
jgi:hypothetical protein